MLLSQQMAGITSSLNDEIQNFIINSTKMKRYRISNLISKNLVLPLPQQPATSPHTRYFLCILYSLTVF